MEMAPAPMIEGVHNVPAVNFQEKSLWWEKSYISLHLKFYVSTRIH